LFKKCVEEEKISSKRYLCLDVPTRWNSTHLMLSSAIVFEKAFDRLEEQDGVFLKDNKDKVPTEYQWQGLRSLHKFLEYFLR